MEKYAFALVSGQLSKFEAGVEVRQVEELLKSLEAVLTHLLLSDFHKEEVGAIRNMVRHFCRSLSSSHLFLALKASLDRIFRLACSFSEQISKNFEMLVGKIDVAM